MAIATASNLTAHVAGNLLFEGVSFKLDSGDRMTLAGRNGAGKSTLLRMLAGELAVDAGALSVRRGSRVALHDQRPPRDSGQTLAEYVLSGRAETMAAEAELERLEGVMSEGDSGEETLGAYAKAQATLEAAGGYRWRDEVYAIMAGLGFTEPERDRRLSTFSGGELTRASLARALACDPDLLLLDEPTNHLDIPTLEWLEEYLQGLDAAIVLVAHDRWFLEAVGNSVLEIEAGRSRYFKGPWHAWRKEKAAREIAVGKEVAKQEAAIVRMERFVERFRYKATKARQAQSKLKKIERAKAATPSHDPKDRRRLEFSFATPERTARVAVNMVKARIEVPGRVLLEDADLVVERGEHVALVGPNGAGKTTLLATLAGEREPAAGSVRHGHNVRIGYLSQHAETAAGQGTVLDAATRETGLSSQKARSLLGAFLFTGRDVETPLSEISGGEQRRLSLAILVASGANVLLLDEPTNHLDVESREALEEALLAFEGVVVLVSHDRALLEAVGHRTVVCERGRLESHPHPWATYWRDRQDRGSTATPTTTPTTPSPNPQLTTREGGEPSVRQVGEGGVPPGAARQNARKKAERSKRRLSRLEREVEEAEAALSALEDELADPAAWSTPEKTEAATRRHSDAKAKLEQLYGEWEEAEAAAVGVE